MTKYIIYTIIVFFLALLQSSLFASLHLFAFIHVLFILLFAYYIARKSTLSLYLLFIGGVFLDFLTFTQIGVTSANTFISLLVYTAVLRIVPNERIGRAIAIGIASLVFSMISYLSVNFLASSDSRGVFGVIPWALVSACLIFMLTETISFIRPSRQENKIRIS